MPLGLHQSWNRVREARADLRAVRAQTEQLMGAAAQLAQRLEGLGESVRTLESRVEQAEANRATDHARVLHALRIIRDGDPGNWDRLWKLRADPTYEAAFTEAEPLVSILVPTFNNWEGLRDRSLPSVLAQTYENWECVVVGDAAVPQAAEVVASFGDARLRFVNLPYRGPYPDRREDAWLISGTNPFNTAMRLANGRWIAATADDDALLPGAVASLLALARERHAELAYGQLRLRHPDRDDELLGEGPPPRMSGWGVQASLFHAGLRFVPLLYSDWLFGMPNDWSWGERLLRIGVRFAMLEEPVVDYYPSQEWKAVEAES